MKEHSHLPTPSVLAFPKVTSDTDWRDLKYLDRGTVTQRAAGFVLRALRVFEHLKGYSPALAGTIPLDIDVEGSDLDIICSANDLAALEDTLKGAFGSQNGFQVHQKLVRGVPSLVADFSYEGMALQVFAQPRAVEEQNAYRHMVVEARLLEIGGDTAREEIRRLKRAGLKTEPAFAQYWQLAGDPYEVLLELSYLAVTELRERLKRR